MKDIIVIFRAIVQIVKWWTTKSYEEEVAREALKYEVKEAIVHGDTRNLHRIISGL